MGDDAIEPIDHGHKQQEPGGWNCVIVGFANLSVDTIKPDESIQQQLDYRPATLTFHPCHAQQRLYHDVILKVDGTHFWASKSLLVRRSTFFKDVEDIFHVALVGALKPIAIRELPSATPRALSLLLLLLELKCQAPCAPSSARQATLRLALTQMEYGADYKLLGELYTTIDVYGFDCITIDVLGIDDGWMVTTWDLLTGQPPLRLQVTHGQRRRMVHKEKEGYWLAAPQGAQEVLDSLAPGWRETIKPWHEQHVAWYDVLDKIRQEADHPQGDFGPKCRHVRCQSYKRSKGDWSNLTRYCSKVVIPVMWKEYGSTYSHFHMSGAVYGTLDCQYCAGRLVERFGGIITTNPGLWRRPKFR